ncbi:MAG: EAL domain-containing protein, partial [[Clostridium] innocuum]
PIHKQDTLTQIFNLEGFVEAAQEILQHTDQQFALFKFGISDFRFINQIHGYAFGDDVLKCIARNLKFFCQEDELCARIEKDTFAVLLHFTDSDAFHNRLHRIREKLLDASIAACLKHPIQYIGGVYLIKDACGESIKSMLDKAVLAMQYVERNSRISDFLYFEDWMLYQKNRSSELLEEAVKAMQEDTFQLYIQPQFQLSDEKIISGEALSRWFLEDGSCVPPDEFIPLFEKHGMISSFDFYVLHKLCKLMRQWMDAGKQLLPVSVNQSRLHIKEEHYLQNFCNIVDSYAIPHEMIVFELTESAFTDCANDLQVFMKNIHEAGFQIAIDDFGTGYAGIGMLSQVDADILKLDKGMLNGINTDRRQMTIFWKIIEMAHSIGMQVICEGIETMEQFVDLKMLRCDIGQGFLVSRAIAATEFAEKYLR